MKKILIISYTYPPNPGVGGIRIKNFAKYFERYGYETFILTAKLPNILNDDTNRVIQTEEEFGESKNNDNNRQKIIDRILEIKIIESITRYLKYYYFFPDRYKWWFRYAYPKAEEIFKEKKIDIVITSAIPVVAHFVGAKLKEKYDFFWVAEYRDLWTYNHYYPTDFIYTFFSKSLERKILKNADHLVTVSQPLAENLKKVHPNKPITVITNGFDPKEKVFCDLTNKFTITYTGILYEGRRDPSLLFEVVNFLIINKRVDKNKIEIRFYGPKSEWLKKKINHYSLNEIVKQYGEISRQEILKIQAESQLLLLLMYDHPEERGVYTAKVFEYLNANRPILALGNKNSVINGLLINTNAGVISYEQKEILRYTLKYYNEFIQNGSVNYNGRKEAIMSFSFDQLIYKYIKIFSTAKCQ